MEKRSIEKGKKDSLIERVQQTILSRLEEPREELRALQEEIAGIEKGISRHKNMQNKLELEVEDLNQEVMVALDSSKIIETIGQHRSSLEALAQIISEYQAKLEDARSRLSDKLKSTTRMAQVALREIGVQEGKAIQEEAEQLLAHLTELEASLSEATQLTRYVPEYEDAQHVRYNARRPSFPTLLPRGLERWV